MANIDPITGTNRNPLNLHEGERVRALRQLVDPSDRSFVHADVGQEGVVVHVDEGMGDLPTVSWPRGSFLGVDEGDVERVVA
jgi:hypothetical protein